MTRLRLAGGLRRPESAAAMEIPFKPRQRVRLVRDIPPVGAGSDGVVIGYYNREPPTYVVSFEQGLLSDRAPDDLVSSEEPEG